MTRILAIDPATATAAAKQTLDAVKAKLGVVPNMARGMAQSPAVVAGWAGLFTTLGQGLLTPRIREQSAKVMDVGGDGEAARQGLDTLRQLGRPRLNCDDVGDREPSAGFEYAERLPEDGALIR